MDDPENRRRFWLERAGLQPVDVGRPGPGQESVWDYPRPPRIQAVSRRIRVEMGGIVLASSGRGLRVIETASPPTYYFPPEDVRSDLLERDPGRTFCEWKGEATYWTINAAGRISRRAAWSYPDPAPEFEAIRDFVAFFAGRVDACFVGDDAVIPQPGGFYGGWITPELTGPFKGGPGTGGW